MRHFILAGPDSSLSSPDGLGQLLAILTAQQLLPAQPAMANELVLPEAIFRCGCFHGSFQCLMLKLLEKAGGNRMGADFQANF